MHMFGDSYNPRPGGFATAQHDPGDENPTPPKTAEEVKQALEDAAEEDIEDFDAEDDEDEEEDDEDADDDEDDVE